MILKEEKVMAYDLCSKHLVKDDKGQYQQVVGSVMDIDLNRKEYRLFLTDGSQIECEKTDMFDVLQVIEDKLYISQWKYTQELSSE